MPIDEKALRAATLMMHWEPDVAILMYLEKMRGALEAYEAAKAPAKGQPDEAPHPEKACQDCGGRNPVWFAPNSVWNLVMGGPDAKGDPGGIICPVCFIQRANACGVPNTGWELRPELPEREIVGDSKPVEFDW